MSDVEFNFEDDALDFSEAPEVEQAETEEVVEEPVAVEETKNEKHDEFLKIYDAMMFEGSYEDSFKFGKKYDFRLKTRTSGADATITRAIDRMQFKTLNAFTTAASLMSLSYSLVEYCGTDLSTKKPEERYEYIRENIASQVVEIMTSKLVEFDNNIREALEYGAQNF